MDPLFVPSGEFARQLKVELAGNILPFWMNLPLDRVNGGFHGAISNTLDIDNDEPRSAILCARILWTFSSAYRRFRLPAYLDTAAWAFSALTETFWDAEFGGVYWSVNADGKPVEPRKHHYAQAFAVYGLSEYYRAAQVEQAKTLACRLFDLLEQHAFEPEFGGYIEGSCRDWGPLDDMRLSSKEINSRKSMNTMLHMLEAYTNLMRIWDDPRLVFQHRSMLEVFYQKVFDSRTGHLRLLFDDAWTSLEALDSYGHDIEASWLMWEAARMHADSPLREAVCAASLKIAETILHEARDEDGSLFYEGLDGKISDDNKVWWVQAEAMVGFWNAYQLSGKSEFAAAAQNVWHFIDKHLIDRKHGDWFKQTDRDGTPHPLHPKAGFWECPYHHARACLEILERCSDI